MDSRPFDDDFARHQRPYWLSSSLSFPSTMARYSLSFSADCASKRSTSAGWGLEARISPQPSACLFHLSLEQRMTRLPHDRLAVMFRDVVVEPLRTFDFRDDHRPGIALEHVAGEQDQQLIAPQDRKS